MCVVTDLKSCIIFQDARIIRNIIRHIQHIFSHGVLMARKGLPKKYAKMGFKRGWAAYKRSKRTARSPSRVKTRSYKKRRVSVAKKRYYRRARYGGGKYKPLIDGAIVGIAERFVGGMIPVPGAIKLGVGIFRNNTTLTTLGALQLFGNFLGGNGGNGGGVR